ncbi:unnamed protein product [Spirodela intermedia]|uniref:Choline transporter-like protein n=1 Tax=Spirodela intermedia TaxID=51605 RepID=A0A7I8JUU5_SPIIN|nr:unnamed protein product [Spirodela intermedia]CAA6673501.1 unnamed protein product [Spirodela intermedia]
MLWSLTVMVETQVYVVSGTVAQWYFSREGKRPRRIIRSSLSGIRVVRAIVDSANLEDGTRGIVNVMLKCCANLLLSAIHFVNKFTINFAAITGEGYCSSARMAYELLKRNLLSAVFVETVSTRILVGINFVLSAVYAILVWVILRSVSSLGMASYLVAASSWLLLMAVLGFLVHVLDEVIDTVYVCFAIDRDKGEVSKQEVHAVYVLLPISRNDRPSLAARTPPLLA